MRTRTQPHIRVERLSERQDRGYTTPCLIFTGCLLRGYGQISLPKANGRGPTGALTHRVMYEHYVGDVPAGLELDHLCRQRDCVDPTHLEPVTRAENVRRGLGPSLLRERGARQTHCKHGHEFTDANTYYPPSGHKRRQCKTCLRAATVAWRERLKEAS